MKRALMGSMLVTLALAACTTEEMVMGLRPPGLSTATTMLARSA